MSVVYLVEIDRRIKIGFTTNLTKRMKAFATTCPNIRVLATIPGDRALERRLHKLFAAAKIQGEVFHADGEVLTFIERLKLFDLAYAIKTIEEGSPERRRQATHEQHERRVREKRRTRAEERAHFVAVVADRKRRLGW
jgi:hypothetical protein